MTTESEAYCEAALPRVSRTFAAGIAALPSELRRATTAGYLVCRISDAIEDQTSLPIPARRAALEAWRREVLAAALGATAPDAGVPARFLRLLPSPPTGGSWPTEVSGTSEADRELVENRRHVLALLGALPRDVASLVAFHAVEMAQGMAAFLQDGATRPIATWDDLDRYCYYVAGTVGHMLTGLFLIGRTDDHASAELEARATSFGIGLQLVNVAKDAAGDLIEGRCFVPREAWPPGFEGVADPGVPDSLRAPILAIVARAHGHLRRANEYVLALPADALAARKFCAMALHLAIQTLTAIERSDTLTDPKRPPKISRGDVMDTILWLEENAGDDARMAARFEELTRR